MIQETGRSVEDQAFHEFTVIKDLEDAHSATNNWREREAPGIYRTRFVDSMLRIQAGDVHTIRMSHQTDPAGEEVVRLTLPIIVPLLRNTEATIQARVKNLELTEPAVRDLLPDPSSQ